MATVLGIFENCYIKQKPLTVVRPGTQTKDLHIDDTIKTCFEAWKKDSCKHCSISNKKICSIIDVAKLFKTKINLLPKTERIYASTLTNLSYDDEVYKRYGKIPLKEYINSFIKSIKNENR